MTDFLDTQATQIGFAGLVGTSQPSVSGHVHSGTLITGQTYRQWLLSYCEKLRLEAAGRGGDAQGALTAARTEEATASAQLKQLQIMEKAGKLVDVEYINQKLHPMVVAMRTEMLALPDKLVAEVKSLYGFDIDPALPKEKVDAALNHLADTLQDIIRQSPETDGLALSATADTDND